MIEGFIELYCNSWQPIQTQIHLSTTLGLLRPFKPIRHHPRPTQVHLAHQASLQAHLDTLGPLSYLRPTQITLGPFRHFRPIQPLYAHLVTLGPFRLLQAHLGTLGPFRYTWPIRHHFRFTQCTLGPLDALGPLGTALGPLKHFSRFSFTQICFLVLFIYLFY